LYNVAQRLEAFSVAVDVSSDAVDTAELVLFIINEHLSFNITEELATSTV
jgi:hypothetical protein